MLVVLLLLLVVLLLLLVVVLLLVVLLPLSVVLLLLLLLPHATAATCCVSAGLLLISLLVLQGAQLSWVSDLQEEMASLYSEVLSVAAEARRADQRQQQQHQELSLEAARVGKLENTLRKAEAELQTKSVLLADDRAMLRQLFDGRAAGERRLAISIILALVSPACRLLILIQVRVPVHWCSVL